MKSENALKVLQFIDCFWTILFLKELVLYDCFFFRAACEFTFSNGTIRVNKEGDSCVPKEFNQVVFLCNRCDGQSNRIIEI